MVVGGDGSVNEATQALAGRDGVELAVLPRGTGVDFVREFGIPRKPAEAAAVALAGKTRALDLGRVTYRAWAGGEGVSWFANVASAGMSGAIAKRTNESSKALGGKVSYLWSTLAVFSRWHADAVTVTVDGETARGDDARRDRRQLPLLRRRDEDLPGRGRPTTASSTCSCSAT